MKRTLLLVALLAAFASPLFATTVNPSALSKSGLSYIANASFTSSDAALQAAVRAGSELLLGTQIAIGNFNVSDALLFQNASDPAYLLQHFEIFGPSTVIGSGLAANDTNRGYFTSNISNPTATGNPANFFGEQIYMFVVAGTDNSSFASAISTAFQLGIYYMPFDTAIGGDADWKFPPSNVSPATNIDITDLTVAQAGATLASAAKIVIGSFGEDTSNKVPTAKNFSLASVPEPGAVVLLAVGGAFIAARRRRMLS